MMLAIVMTAVGDGASIHVTTVAMIVMGAATADSSGRRNMIFVG